MADAETPRVPEEASAGDARVLLVIVVTNPSSLDHLITGLVDLGLAATIVESKGLMSLLREEMPIFGGLTALLPQSSDGKMFFSFTKRALAEKVFEFINDKFKQAERPIGATVPIDGLIGLRS